MDIKSFINKKFLKDNKLYIFMACLTLLIIVTLAFMSIESKDSNGPGDDSVIMTINGYEIKNSLYRIMLLNEKDLFVYNNFDFESEEEAPEETVESDGIEEIEYNEKVKEFLEGEIDGAKVFDLIRQDTVNSLRKHVYLLQLAKEKGIELSESVIGSVEAEMIKDLKEQGELGDTGDYEEEDIENYFLNTYEVTKQQYLDFLLTQKLKDEVIRIEAKNYVIPDDVILLELGEEYEIKIIRHIDFIYKNDTEKSQKMDTANALLTRIRNGDDMKELVAQYSEDVEKSSNEGIYTLPSSEEQETLINEFEEHEKIFSWVENANKDDCEIINVLNGIYIFKCEDVKLDEEKSKYEKERLKEDRGEDLYEESLLELLKGDKYKPVFIEEVYGSYTRLPGNIMKESVG